MNSRIFFRTVLAASLMILSGGWRPAAADTSHARIIRLSLVQGDVRFARDVHGDPLTSDKTTWETATLNLPIRQGYAVATDHGRAEVEFENGAMAFLAENAVVEFYDLSLQDGRKTTRLVLRQGTASFYVNPASDDYFSVTGGDFTVEADGRTGFRLDNFDDGSVVNVTKGRVTVLRKDKKFELAKGQSLSMRAGENGEPSIARLPNDDDFDRWVSKREDSVMTATTAAQQYVSSPYYTSGLADLYTYGGWYPVAGYGYGWRPYGVGMGWSPFLNGGWCPDPIFGWSFVGYQPWGWLPYHYGGWVFDPFYGWLWSPGAGFGFGFGGLVPFQPVTGVFVRSRNGLLGLVPTHPLDVRGKAPINMTRGVFPVAAGTVSRELIASTAGENWKVLKTAPRESLSASAVSPSAAPTRVSRTIVSNGTSSRVVTLERSAGITYDPREHRFVNGTSAPSAAAAGTAKASTEKAGSATGSAAVRSARTETAAPRPAAAASARGASAPPESVHRASVPSARTMTPPPARSSSGGTWRGGGESGGRGWGGGSSGGARSAPAAAPSHPSGGGRPH